MGKLYGTAVIVAIFGVALSIHFWPGATFWLSTKFSSGRLYHSYYFVPAGLRLRGQIISVCTLIATGYAVWLVLKHVDATDNHP